MRLDGRSDAEVYEEHGQDLVRFATGLVGPDDAPDVVSEAVLSLFGSSVWREARDRRALLYRAVLLRSRSWHRSNGRRRAREERYGAPTTWDLPEVDPQVWSAVMSLSVQQRAVVFLSYWADLPPDRIAELLGVTEGSVRKQLARARKALRRVLS